MKKSRLSIILILICFAGKSLAQGTTKSVSIYITDKNGLPVKNVSIKLSSDKDSINSLVVITNDSGIARFNQIKGGDYFLL